MFIIIIIKLSLNNYNLKYYIISTLNAYSAPNVYHSARPGSKIPLGCPDRTPISHLLTDPLCRRDWLPQSWSGLLYITVIYLTCKREWTWGGEAGAFFFYESMYSHHTPFGTPK